MGAHFDYLVFLLGIIIETIARGVRTAWGYGAGKRTGDSAARACTGLPGQARASPYTVRKRSARSPWVRTREIWSTGRESPAAYRARTLRAPTSNSQIAPSAGPARTRRRSGAVGQTQRA